MKHRSLTTLDAWSALRSATSARIALGRAGGSLPTRAWLDFKAAHAAARDAVHNPFDAEAVAKRVLELGTETLVVDSAAHDRLTFLQRPDLGRRLDDPSRYALQESRPDPPPDLAIIVSDGLSALAAKRQGLALLALLLPRLKADGWRYSPIVIARFGRVALQDEIGQVLGTQLALILLGERPGLGSPDSLGAYLVYGPRQGNTDANRNCVSNIRVEGLPVEAAAETIHYLLTEARRRRISGVQLKDQRAIPATTNRTKLAGSGT
jgi:ethanolamine ammonia-lyase small subunit